MLTALKPGPPPLIRNRTSLAKGDLVWFVPFLIASIFPVFWQLSSLPVLQWDEARLAVNAAEMVDNGNLIVTHYQGSPDMWNTKPPLQIWLMALSIRLFGYSELAIRLPTALAVLSTFAAIFWFCLRAFSSKLIAALSVLILVSSQGYMMYHVARNGDYDALLIFFIVVYTLGFFLYLEEQKQVYWWSVVGGLILAVLTKGVAGLLCAPALLIFAIYRRSLFALLRQPFFYKGIALFFGVVLGYYYWREQWNPGYWQAVYENELGGRYLTVLENHNFPWNWYLESMQMEEYAYWFFVLPSAVWILAWQTAGPVKRFVVLGSIYIILFLVIISTAQTKLGWYEAPVYPIAALIIALGIGTVLKALKSYFHLKKAGLFWALSVFIICAWPYSQVLNNYILVKSVAPRIYWESMFGSVMNWMAHHYPDEKNLFFYRDVLNYQAAYYYQLAYAKKGYHFVDYYEPEASKLKPGQVVIVCKEELCWKLEKQFRVEILHAYHRSRVYRILSKNNINN